MYTLYLTGLDRQQVDPDIPSHLGDIVPLVDPDLCIGDIVLWWAHHEAYSLSKMRVDQQQMGNTSGLAPYVQLARVQY